MIRRWDKAYLGCSLSKDLVLLQQTQAVRLFGDLEESDTFDRSHCRGCGSYVFEEGEKCAERWVHISLGGAWLDAGL